MNDYQLYVSNRAKQQEYRDQVKHDVLASQISENPDKTAPIQARQALRTMLPALLALLFLWLRRS